MHVQAVSIHTRQINLVHKWARHLTYQNLYKILDLHCLLSVLSACCYWHVIVHLHTSQEVMNTRGDEVT